MELVRDNGLELAREEGVREAAGGREVGCGGAGWLALGVVLGLPAWGGARAGPRVVHVRARNTQRPWQYTSTQCSSCLDPDLN